MTDSKQNIPENTWKCSHCGNTVVEIKPPEICPVCKVPRLKIAAVARR